MSSEKATEKWDLEEKIVLAVRSVIDQFENRVPDKIVLKNCNGLENFKEVLERELVLRDYNTKVVINPVNDLKKLSEDNQGEESYIIDVINYLNQGNYPGRLR